MSAHEIAVWVLLAVAALVVVLSGVGVVVARDTVPRLHFVTPITSIAAPLTGVAYAVDQGWGIAAGLVLLIAGLVAVTSPPLAAAIGQASAATEELPSERSS